MFFKPDGTYDYPLSLQVIDSTDRERISVSKEELHRMLESDELHRASVLVFANKQDVAGCMTAAEISQQLSLQVISLGQTLTSSLQNLRKHQWQIQACCGLTGEGWVAASLLSLTPPCRLYQGLEWIASKIKR
jgi:ADP-ribosylation factor-like protein 5B